MQTYEVQITLDDGTEMPTVEHNASSFEELFSRDLTAEVQDKSIIKSVRVYKVEPFYDCEQTQGSFNRTC